MTIATCPTPAGPMRLLVVRPDGAGPFPVVIMYPHVGGLSETMRLMADRVAAGGHFCAVLDLYHRLGTIVLDPQSTDPDAVAIRQIAAASVTDANVLADTACLLDWLSTQRDLRATQVGAIGFGRGGSLAVRVASEFPDRVRAAASVLGFGFTQGGLVATRDRLARITGGLYFAFAEHDDIIPAEVPTELAPLLDNIPAESHLVIHRGVSHPYIFTDRAVHDPDAAARDWNAIFALYARHVRDGSD